MSAVIHVYTSGMQEEIKAGQSCPHKTSLLIRPLTQPLLTKWLKQRRGLSLSMVAMTV